MNISVIIPAYNAAATLPQTLTALRDATPPPFEIIVVNDGSTDETAPIAESFGVRIVSFANNIGAAAAKNRGAEIARGDILFFTDSDILVPPTIFQAFEQEFLAYSREGPRFWIHGIVGLLDENIPHKNWASQFKNLWMRFTYKRFSDAHKIGLFYTSIAAMRRDIFWEVGGFDENYLGASIAEDTEFGQRAWNAGAWLRIAPQRQVVHLKKYSFATVLREDFKRAYALTLMRLRKRGEPFFTSVPFFYQLAVPTIYLTVLCALLGFLTPNFSIAALVGIIFFYLLNLSLLGFLAYKRGFVFAFQSALFLPLDVFVVGLGMLSAFFNFARGVRY